MSLVRAYIALGSNLGNRIGQMQSALKALAEDNQLKVLQISPLYENRAVGMREADDFLNAIAEVETSMAPLALLDFCLEVESKLGRVRTKEWAPRTIDLDIIAYGDEVIEHERLQVPHPRIAERDFVVHPLCAIAPNLEIRGQRVTHMSAALPMDRLTLCELKLELV
jgi:2-amino-4-hydroxy-6-hydroxymethyldihydropteridine diphosphokinase